MSSPVLCVNMNYIGDALMTTPALDRLAQFSGKPVDVIASGAALEVLAGNPAVGRMIPRVASGAFGRCAQLFSELRHGLYETVAILPSIPIYRTIAASSGAKSVIYVPPLSVGIHMAEHMARVIERALGLPESPIELTLKIDPKVSEKARGLIDGLAGDGPLIALNIGATRPQKRWPPRLFAECAKLLFESGARVLLMGGKQDEATASEILEQLGDKSALDITGKTSILEMIALIDICDAVVTGDTAALHIASALKKPVVALFGSTDPAQTGPIGPGLSVVLYNRLACSPCRSHPTCDGRYDCMNSIGVSDVVESLAKLIPQVTF